MSLGWKLFISYVIVVIVGAAVLVVSTASLGPVTFSQHLQSMSAMMGSSMMMDPSTQLQADLDANFRQALNETLLFAALAATVAAGIVSVYISRRIVKPIQETVRASERIADGHYQERLTVYSADELGELTQSFNRMAAALAEIETMRQQLIADISHELKTPLAGIQAYMEGLQDGVMQPGPETYQQVQMEAARLQRLVRDLQELSRAESEQFVLNPTTSDASDLIRAAANWLRPQFQDGDIELHINLPVRPIIVLADPDRIRQVLLNLLGNALQYTPSGGKVTVTLQQKDRQALFSVQDPGIGLADEDLKRIFQRFYRVDKSRARASGGSGIGLTISQAIIRAHNGSLWAESDGPGQGSTFFFSLPIAT
ncbi:MAG: HAMP domain-containing protein [Anaerolineae bacterium]|nr:HAMP domain-containing protein [Anaerolineae bacterium]